MWVRIELRREKPLEEMTASLQAGPTWRVSDHDVEISIKDLKLHFGPEKKILNNFLGIYI